MSLRLEMLQVARLAPQLLGESAPLVEAFFRREQNADGGFKDRQGSSDLYYTVFGLEGLLALRSRVELEPVLAFLRRFGAGERLDFVHLCCLARCWAAAGNLGGPACPDETRARLLARLELFRSRDGGYQVIPGRLTGTVYGCFLALGAYQDLGGKPPDPAGLKACLEGLATPDGAWSNDRTLAVGSTNATAAAITVLRHLAQPVPAAAGTWLLARAHPQGGFLAAPAAPMPDLLSTATALHALAGLQLPLGDRQEACLDFVDSLWTNAGAFHGHWADEHLDCEYTYYGLLALGHLSLPA